MIHKGLVGNIYGLGKDIHELSKFNNNVEIVNKRGNILLLHDDGRGELNRDAHVFITSEGCTKVEVFDIGSH